MEIKGLKDKKTFTILAIGCVVMLVGSYFLYNHKFEAAPKQAVEQVDRSGALNPEMERLAVDYINASKEKMKSADQETEKDRFYYVLFYAENNMPYMQLASSLKLGDRPTNGYTHIGEDLFIYLAGADTVAQKLIDKTKLSEFDHSFTSVLSSDRGQDTTEVYVRKYSIGEGSPRLIFEGMSKQ